ncbi:MAG: septal ring lytic transglycosylase RlpA family protein [Solirubrobacterales bacterium]
MPTINQTSLRWVLALAAILALMAGAAAGAKAATGGASASEGSSSEEEIAFSPYRYGGASWYGPGLWGHKTACGETLRRGTIGVAHKKLPCGTKVKFLYHGHVLITQVIDRGPYVKGRSWDLTQAASEQLGLEGVARVRYAIALNYASSLG